MGSVVLRFTASSGHHSVFERSFFEVNVRPFFR